MSSPDQLGLNSGSTRPSAPRSFVTRWQQVLNPTGEQPQPEDSIPLRILVQALVTIGIVATDFAAADSADPIGVSAWAVPTSLVGAWWSYRQRRKANIPTKFCIAMAMLVALGLFFTRLWGERNDTRLALATLLIHLQVFHSFDLPRRKDLGYSVVIGLILLGVAATLSQTLSFAPLLLLFFAIAVPVLVLDYRSRLGLRSQTFRQIGVDLAPKRLGWILAIVLGLGLAVFLLLPRFPGYQIRAFPVSAPIQLQEQFNSSTVLNPGYVREGEGNGGGDGNAPGLNPVTGPGELNQDFYYGFNSKINQNLRGALKPRVVMRVRSQAPGFWRVLAFDRYTGQGWEVSRNEEAQVQKYERPQWSFRFNLPWSVTLNRTREVIQSYTVVSDLPNLIPVLHEPKELYFPTNQVALDQEGGLRSPVPLSEGLTYTVISEVPYRNRTLLNQAQTRPPSAIRNFYLQVPASIEQPIRQTTEAILARSTKPLTTPYETTLYLAQYLKQNYRIQPELPFFEANQDIATAFLNLYQGGYPDHFATTLTVMLRSIGIPARLAMGFSPGEFNPLTGFYVVKNTDAHAITEVYFHKYGWFGFDPIPGHPLIPPSIEESSAFGVLQQFWNWVAGWLPSPLRGVLSQIFGKLAAGLGWLLGLLTALFTQGWLGLLAGLGLLTGLGFLGWLGWSAWQSWRYRRWLAKLDPMEALYQQMLKLLAERGVTKPAAQTPLEFARHYAAPDRATDRATDWATGQSDSKLRAVEQISTAYVEWRYGGQVPNLEQLKQQLKQLRTQSSGNRRKAMR
jgi:transglutaminase-like putative cysteine protease